MTLTANKIITGSIIFLYASLASSHGKHSETVPFKKSKKTDAHSHAEGSALTLEVGLSVSRSLGNAASSEAGTSAGSSGDDHSGHTHASLIHGGEDHGSEEAGEESGGTTPTAFDPTFTTRLTYNFVPRFATLLMAGYGLSGGVLDPEAGMKGTTSLGKDLTGTGILTASYPASKASKSNFKITTVKLASGPTYQAGKMSLGLQISTNYTWYSRTVLIDDEPSADREFSRWGGTGSIGYNLRRQLRLDSSLGVSLIKHQFGPSKWSTQATLAQLTYSRGNFSIYGGCLLTKVAASPSVPTTPGINLGVGYVFR